MQALILQSHPVGDYSNQDVGGLNGVTFTAYQKPELSVLKERNRTERQ